MIDKSGADAIAAALEEAWKAADGGAFAAQFASDADFVNTIGQHDHGQAAIAANHDRIFKTVYAGSRIKLKVEDLRPLGGSLAIVHIGSQLNVPVGPMAGAHRSLMTVIVDDSEGEPRIVALHNTFIREPSKPTGQTQEVSSESRA